MSKHVISPSKRYMTGLLLISKRDPSFSKTHTYKECCLLSTRYINANFSLLTFFLFSEKINFSRTKSVPRNVPMI